MKQIMAPLDVIIKAIGIQEIKNAHYRQMKYVQTSCIDNGMLLYNLVTRELIFLNESEKSDYDNFDCTDDTLKKLTEKWFIVPDDFDDYLFSIQSEEILKIVSYNNKNPKIKNFTIFSTTDCNARCFYCYELGCKRINMTHKIAEDSADYIIRKSNGKHVYISWFGGEPLYNTEAIDVICRRINEAGISFSSDMTTNGYLFDENVIKTAITKWNLNKVQISLDGTEEVYNRSKAYIYKDCDSPFKRVLNNIELLLKNDIAVHIRLNMDMHNFSDLSELCSQLSARFKKYPKFKVYIALLFERDFEIIRKRSDEEKTLLYRKSDELYDYLKENGIALDFYITAYRTAKPCMAADDESLMILPDGKLGKCEHCTETKTIGSIYSDSIDSSVLEYFKEMSELSEKCRECSLMPKCRYLKNCPVSKIYCDDLDKQYNIKSLIEQMNNTYLFVVKNNFNPDNNGSSC